MVSDDLPDRAAIHDVIVLLAYIQDGRKWRQFGRVFSDEVTLDLSQHFG